MQNNPSSNRAKKILYIALSTLLVLVAAFATAYVLSRVSAPTPVKVSTEIPLSQKLAELYKSSISDGTQNGSLNNVIVQKSGTDGYNNAHAMIVGTKSDDGSVAYFYQTTDSNWHFFTISKNLDSVACSDYNTDDLVNAYIGFTCRDTSTNSSAFVHKANPTFQIEAGSSGG